MSQKTSLYQISFYVPESHLESVKAAIFTTGAGKLGHYSECCWETPGMGQFRPLVGSQPFLGKPDQLHRVREYRVELICREALLTAALAALKRAHPYEEPAYSVIRLASL